jgi:hypothetical protein
VADVLGHTGQLRGGQDRNIWNILKNKQNFFYITTWNFLNYEHSITWNGNPILMTGGPKEPFKKRK